MLLQRLLGSCFLLHGASGNHSLPTSQFKESTGYYCCLGEGHPGKPIHQPQIGQPPRAQDSMLSL